MPMFVLSGCIGKQAPKAGDFPLLWQCLNYKYVPSQGGMISPGERGILRSTPKPVSEIIGKLQIEEELQKLDGTWAVWRAN